MRRDLSLRGSLGLPTSHLEFELDLAARIAGELLEAMTSTPEHDHDAERPQYDPSRVGLKVIEGGKQE